MARIPIAAIPNAPGVGPGPVLNQPSQRIRRAAPVDRSALAVNTGNVTRAQSLISQTGDNISRGARIAADSAQAGKRRRVDINAFSGESAGLARVGVAIQQAGAVTAAFAQRMMEAKDVADIARVDTMMRLSADQHQLDIESGKIPVGEYVSSWQEKIKELNGSIESLGLSGRARQAVDADFVRFTGSQSIAFARVSYQHAKDIAKNDVLNSSGRAFLDGDVEGSIALVQDGVRTGILRPDEAEAHLIKLEGAQRDELLSQSLNEDPQGFLAEMEAGKKEGKSERFSWMKPSDFSRWDRAARSQVGILRDAEDDSIIAGIADGTITNPEEIRLRGESVGLNQRTIAARVDDLNMKFRNSPEFRVAYIAKESELYTKISTYDPRVDPDGSQYRALRREIKDTMDPSDRDALLTPLQDALKEGKLNVVSEIKSAVFRQVDDLLAPDEKQKKALKRKSEIEQNSAAARQVEESLRIKKEFIELPREIREDPIKSMEWLGGRMRRENLGIGAEQLKGDSPMLKHTWRYIGAGSAFAPARMGGDLKTPTPEDIDKLFTK